MLINLTDLIAEPAADRSEQVYAAIARAVTDQARGDSHFTYDNTTLIAFGGA